MIRSLVVIHKRALENTIYYYYYYYIFPMYNSLIITILQRKLI